MAVEDVNTTTLLVRCGQLVTWCGPGCSQGLHCVDLLKVDVERAELEVLQGIEEADWPKVRQLVVEVHDVEGRLAAVQALLQGRAGFRVCVVDQDSQLTGSTLYNVYCRRQL